MNPKSIVAVMRPDWVPPYCYEHNHGIPVVIQSNPRFVVGWRLDYGFVQVALREGYDVTIEANPHTQGSIGG